MDYQKWFDKYARHMVDVELYAEARAQLAGTMLDNMHRDLKAIIDTYGVIKSKRQEEECIKRCNECIEKYLSEWEDDEDEERSKFADKEFDWLKESVAVAFGIALAVTLLKKSNALSTPFSDTDTFKSFVQTMKENIQKAIRTPLLSSRIFGSPTTTVSESLETSFERIKRNADANMKSSVTGLQRNVTFQLIGNVKKLKYEYVSMLDDKTCLVCAGYSGNVYDDMSQAPAVPVHIRCRCYYIPVLSDSDKSEESYEEWFERQPDSVKYKILGPSRYNFYKSGLTKIKSFSSKGRTLTLEELFEKNK